MSLSNSVACGCGRLRGLPGTLFEDIEFPRLLLIIPLLSVPVEIPESLALNLGGGRSNDDCELMPSPLAGLTRELRPSFSIGEGRRNFDRGRWIVSLAVIAS